MELLVGVLPGQERAHERAFGDVRGRAGGGQGRVRRGVQGHAQKRRGDGRHQAGGPARDERTEAPPMPARGAAPGQPAAPGHRGDARLLPRRNEALHRLRVGRGRRPQAIPPQKSRERDPPRRANRVANLPADRRRRDAHARATRHAPRHQTRERPRHPRRPVQSRRPRPRAPIQRKHNRGGRQSRHAVLRLARGGQR